MRTFAQCTLLGLLLLLVTATLPCDARAGELAEDGWSNAFHKAFDNETDPAKRLKALRDEQGRQQAWLDAAVKKADKNMPAKLKKQFAASQSKWEKWYGLERKFLEAVSPNGTLNDELEHYLLGILVLRTNFMRVQPMNIESETNDRYVPKPIVFAKVRDGMARDPDGMTTDREERKTEDGLVVAPNLVVSMEHEIQDKWLNADFKALRDCLDDTQKIALRDTQRAWLQWHDADCQYIYDVIGDGGVREWLQYRELRKFALRAVQIEYLLARVGSKGKAAQTSQGAMPAAAGAKGDASPNGVVEVKTAHELIAAIASNTTIKLAPGRYVLSDVVKEAVNKGNGTEFKETPDGPKFNITGVRNLTIKGGDNPADYEIVTDPKYTAVMDFYNCKGIKFVGLTMGREPGECSGSVLDFTTCSNIEIENCDLYGSQDGIDTFEVQGLKVTGGTIRDSSRHLAVLTLVNGALFTEVSMVRRNGAGPAIWLGDFVPDLVTDVVFDRVNFVSSEAPEASKIFIGSCGKGFTVKNCTARCVNGKEILFEKKLDLGTNLSTKQISGLGFNGAIIGDGR